MDARGSRLAEEGAHTLLRLARHTLEAALRGLPPPPAPDDDAAVRFEQVNITVRLRGRVRASTSGLGDTLAAAVVQAARAAAADARFGAPLTTEGLAASQLELWIQCAQEPIVDITRLDLGRDGVALRLGAHAAYYKPSVPLTSRLLGPERVLRRLALKAGLAEDAWRDPASDIRRTAWDHFTEREPGGVVQQRSRLRAVLGSSGRVCRENVMRCLQAAEDRLLRVQQADGLFLYRHHPFRALTQPAAVHLVRQAGCAFALARAAAVATDAVRADRLRQGVVRSAQALLAGARTLDGGLLHLPEADDTAPVFGKLGSIALLLAALQHIGPYQPLAVARGGLLQSVLAMQREDGSFRCRSDSAAAADDGVLQDFYPGEALVALCLALPDQPEAAGRAVTRAFPWYQARFRARPTTAPVLWHADAWRLFAAWCAATGAHDPEPYAAFVFELADWVLALQPDDDESADRDWSGGFRVAQAPADFGTSLFTEAVIRAYGLALAMGLADRAARYRQAARRGLQFTMRLQITPETASLFPDPPLSVGGTTHSLSDLTIRCDYDQHAITAYLAALDHPDLLDPVVG
jgi:AMMECR1 domain-containing protein